MSFFERVTGLSFMEYLNHYRIERAQALLATTDDSMASISQEMGFCDQSYFERGLPQRNRNDPRNLSPPLPEQELFSPIAQDTSTVPGLSPHFSPSLN